MYTLTHLLIQQVKKEVGDVSILVNNAGVVTGKYTFTEAPDNLVDRTLRVNVAAHFWVIELVISGEANKTIQTLFKS